MIDAIETFEHNGFTVKICADPDPCDPRKEFDHMVTLACWHRRMDLGDERIDPGTTIKTIVGDVRRAGDKALAILPLYIYEHGGVTMRTGEFSDPFDSGQVGWAYVTRKNAEKMGCVNATPVESVAHEKLTGRAVRYDRDFFEKAIRDEVKEYDDYLTGQVFGYIVEDEEGDELESCWGFYGELDYVRQEAKSAAEHARRPGQVDGGCDARCE